MKVGDKVYLKAVGNMARREKDLLIKENIVRKIGRKYFEVSTEDYPRLIIKFYISDHREATIYAADWKLYFSEQEIRDEEEKKRICWDFRCLFDTWDESKLSLKTLREIKLLIDAEDTP